MATTTITGEKVQSELSKSINDALPIVVKTAAIVTGIEIARVIIHHRRLLATIATLAGAAYLANKGLPKLAAASKDKRGDAPSFPGENVRTAVQEPEDEIDEAMMASFPASDPPASYHRS